MSRIIDETTGQPMSFTCENRRFKTDTESGYAHGPQGSRGSAYEESLLSTGEWSLWLEHVVDKQNHDRLFWLMWYDGDGKPTIPMSGVFSRDDLEQIVGRLAQRL